MIDHRHEGVNYPSRRLAQYDLLWPDLSGANKRNYTRCALAILVAKDCTRVLIGGGEFGYDGIARSADLVEVDALAERFRLPVLRRVADNMRASKANDSGR